MPPGSMTTCKPEARCLADFTAALKDITALQTDRRYRDTRRTFVIEGVRNFVQLADNGFAIECIIFSERLLTAPLARKLLRRCRRSGVHTLSVTPEQFRQLPFTKRASGVAAIVRQSWTSLKDASPQQHLCQNFVRIPMQAGTDSLNLGVAGSLLMYEVYRKAQLG